MATRDYKRPRIRGGERIIIEGSFAPNGSSALVATDVKGKGFSVAYTSTGLYTITFEETYLDMECFHAFAALNAALDIKCQGGIYTAASKTMQIRSLAVAALTDIAANANNRIHFIAIFKNTAGH